jgi:hypothetical protein
VENFAKKIVVHSGFEREVFVLSSGEDVTAARVVQNIAPLWRRPKTGDGRAFRLGRNPAKSGIRVREKSLQARACSACCTVARARQSK